MREEEKFLQVRKLINWIEQLNHRLYLCRVVLFLAHNKPVNHYRFHHNFLQPSALIDEFQQRKIKRQIRKHRPNPNGDKLSWLSVLYSREAVCWRARSNLKCVSLYIKHKLQDQVKITHFVCRFSARHRKFRSLKRIERKSINNNNNKSHSFLCKWDDFVLLPLLLFV